MRKTMRNKRQRSSLPMNPYSCMPTRRIHQRGMTRIGLAISCLVIVFTGSTQRLAAQNLKTASAFYPGTLVARARANAREHAWAAEIRDSLVEAARPWMAMSDDELWELMFANTIRR